MTKRQFEAVRKSALKVKREELIESYFIEYEKRGYAYLNLRPESMDGEIWKEIPNWPSHQISSLGRVKSFEKPGYGESIMIQGKHRLGYLKIFSSNVEKGKVGFYIHRLVAEAFVENPDWKAEVNHIGGDKMDNRASELEWCTRKENIRHACKTGLIQARKGIDCNKTKLTVDQVVLLKTKLKLGIPQRKLAKEFNITQSAISLINKGKNWASVKI